jgi:hypothetical protein
MHQRMLHPPDLRADRLEVHVLHPRLGRDFPGRRPRDDAETGLLQREGRLEVEPFLHAIGVAEDGAQLVRAPQMPEQRVVENAGSNEYLENVTGVA